MNFRSAKTQEFLRDKSPIYGCAQTYPCPPHMLDQHNEYGFREKREYKTAQSIALGCSYTYGAHLNREEAWPWLLEQLIETEVYNFGVGGGGLDTISRLAYYWVPKIRPKNVLIALKNIGLFEIFWNGSWIKLTPSENGFWEGVDITMKEEQLFSKENVYINYYKHVEFIKHICRKYACNLVLIDDDIPKSDHLAADGLHGGAPWHVKTCDLFYNRLKGK